MLVIKIELWPFGQVTRAREIGRIFVANTGVTTDGVHYDYSVKADEMGSLELGTPARSEEFRVEKHDRFQSVFNLLGKVFSRLSEPQKTTD